MRPPAPLPSFPRFTSLPFPPQLLLHRYDWPDDLLASSNERRPLAPVLLGRTKQKQSKSGQRRSEAAAEVEERGSGQRSGDRSADQGPGRAAPAARGVSTGAARTLWGVRGGGCALSTASVSPQVQPHVGRGRGRGGGRVRSGLVWVGGAGVSGRLFRAPPAPPRPPQRPGQRRAHPAPSPGPGARRRGPAPPGPQLRWTRRAGRSPPKGCVPSPPRPRFYFSVAGGRRGARFWLDGNPEGGLRPPRPPGLHGSPRKGHPSLTRPIQARPCAPRPGSGRDWRPRGSGPAPAAGPLPWGPRSRRAVGRRTRARRRPCADWAAPLLRQRVVFLFFWGEEGGYVFSLNEICQRRQRQEGSPLSVESELCLLHWAVWCCSVPASVWLLRELRKPFAEVNVARLPRPCEHCLRCQQQNSIYR